MNHDLTFIDGLRSRLLGNNRDAARLPGECVTEAETTIFVLDRSSSMGLTDYGPTRYLAGVGAVREFIKIRRASGTYDIMGAIVFEFDATVVCPGVEIARAEREIVDALERIEPNNGTDIEKGLITARKCFRATSSVGRSRVVLLTDGHGGRPEKIAKAMHEEGILIDVIGIGGSREEVNEECLQRVASVVDGQTRYRFIGDGSLNTLNEHFRCIATDLSIKR